MEVPTIISYSSLRGIVEQNVDIPVPRGRGRVGLFLHQGQSSTAFGGAEFLPAATAEQNFDIPVPRGSRDLPPASSSSRLPGTANQGVFRSFPRRKKVRRWVRTQGRNWVRSTPAAQLEGFFTDAAGVWMQFPSGGWKLLGSDPEVWRPG